MKKAKRILLIIVLFIVLLQLSGCYFPDSIVNSDYPGLYQMVMNSVIDVGNLQWDKMQVIEEDSNGRILFKYSSQYGPYLNNITVLAISQKISSASVHYYDDICYIVKASWEEFDENDTEELKDRNDWEKDLDESKMVSLTFSKNDSYSRNKSKFVSDDIKNILYKSVSLEPDIKLYSISSLFYDKYGREILIFLPYKDTKEQFNEESNIYLPYLICLDSNGNYNPNTFIIQLSDFYDYNDELKQFKIDNNWNK